MAKYGFDKVSNSVVHHRNRIPWDNRFDNIELMDSQRQHAIHHVENGHKGSLNVDDVLDIRDSFSAGSSTAELAEKYGVAPKTVRQIVKKESWAWLD